MKYWLLLPWLFLLGCQVESEALISGEALNLALVSNKCRDQQGECRLTASEGEISLSFSAKISPLQLFTVQLDVEKWASELESITLDFKMSDMDMGKNRYRLLKQSEDRWQSRVVLPICGMGGKEWLLQLTLIDVAGQRWSVKVPLRVQ